MIKKKKKKFNSVMCMETKGGALDINPAHISSSRAIDYCFEEPILPLEYCACSLYTCTHGG